jgi:phosphoribosylglycinamide formyltransferase 1
LVFGVEETVVLRIAFLASRNGTGLRVLLEARERGQIDFVPALVVASSARASVRDVAQEKAIPCEVLSFFDEASDEALLRLLSQGQVDVILLVGFLKKIGSKVLAEYRGRIFNIHPSLLPMFGGSGMYGMKVHESVIVSGEKRTGATIHVVSEEYDEGPCVLQRSLEVYTDDDPSSLQRRVASLEAELLIELVHGLSHGALPLPFVGENAHVTE